MSQCQCYTPPGGIYWAPPDEGHRVVVLRPVYCTLCRGWWMVLVLHVAMQEISLWVGVVMAGLTCCTLIAQCATGVSPIALTQARWSCFNQPSSTHTATVGLKKISKCICCVNSARWGSEHANDTTALHMFLVSTLTTGWISHLLVSKTDFLCRCTEPSPLLAGEPSIQ